MGMSVTATSDTSACRRALSHLPRVCGIRSLPFPRLLEGALDPDHEGHARGIDAPHVIDDVNADVAENRRVQSRTVLEDSATNDEAGYCFFPTVELVLDEVRRLVRRIVDHPASLPFQRIQFFLTAPEPHAATLAA